MCSVGLKGAGEAAREGKMTMSVPENISGSGGKEEESEDESEILEESPCGRWQKRREQVTLRLDANGHVKLRCHFLCKDDDWMKLNSVFNCY